MSWRRLLSLGLWRTRRAMMMGVGSGDWLAKHV